MKIDANEMFDAQVQFVSLVERGANRAPIKKLKSEGTNPMIDFKIRDIFVQKNEQEPGQILAVLAAKGTDLDALKGIMVEAELVTEHVSEIDGATVFAQKEDIELGGEGQAVYKISENVAVVCTVAKEFQPFQFSTDFGTNLNANGFFPGVALAQDALREVVFTVMMDATSPDEAASAIQKAAEDLAGHLGSLTRALPETAFKLEVAVQKFESGLLSKAMAARVQPGNQLLAPDASQAEDGEEIANSPVANKDDVGGINDLTPGEQEAEDSAEAKANAAAAGGVLKTSDPASKAKDKDKKPNPFAKKVEELTALVTSLGETLKTQNASLTAEIAKIAKQAAGAQSVAKSAEEAVRGSVGGEPNADVKKIDEDGWDGVDPPLLDTAFDKVA